MKKVGIIGHFGGNEEFLDGQTIKTKILYDELKKTGNFDISIVDVYYIKRNPLKGICDTLKCLCKTKTVFVLLSDKGMRTYFPFLYYWKKFFGLNIYHDVIGGNLSAYVKKYPSFKKYLNSFNLNLVELKNMVTELNELGITNAVMFPNFKRLKHIKQSEIVPFDGEVFKFCTFSRVMKEKGIEDAIEAVENINKKAGKTVCVLDIYGVVDEGYAQRFEEILSQSTDSINYKGKVRFDESVETIKNYYALLFPTFWNGEGFAGTIIDAFASAVPIIATDWNLNAEIITHLKNGIIYPNDIHKDLQSAIEWAIENKEKMYEMRINALAESKEYDVDILMEKIVKMIDGEFNL